MMEAMNANDISKEAEAANESCDKSVPLEDTKSEEIKAAADSESSIETADADMKPKEAAEVYTGIDGAVARLREWCDKANDKNFATPVIEHLVKRCEESESLSKDVCQPHKTWKKCFDYIYRQARKQAEGNCAAVRDEVVYEWAEDYFRLDDKAEEKTKRKRNAAEGTKQNKNSSEKTSASKTEKKPEITNTDSKPQPKPKKNELDGQMDLLSMLGL